MKTLLIALLTTISFGLLAQEKTTFLNVMAVNGLNMRSKPDSKARVITKIPYGKVVTVFESTSEELQVGWVKDNWYKVGFRGREGYVFGGYLSSLVPPQEMNATILSEVLPLYCEKNFSLQRKPIETLEVSSVGDTLRHTLLAYDNGLELELEEQVERTSSKLILTASIQEVYVLLEALLTKAKMKDILNQLRFIKGNEDQLTRMVTSDDSITIAAHSDGRCYVNLVSWKVEN